MSHYSKMSGAGLVVLGDHTRTDTEEVLMSEALRKGEYQPIYKPQIK